MILAKIRDEIARSVGGNKDVQNSVMDPKFLDAGIISYRAEIAYRNYKRDKWLNEQYYQEIKIIANPDLQLSAPCDGVILTQQMGNVIPPFVKLGNYDGISFCGSIDGQAWVRIRNKAQLSNIQNHPLTNFRSTPKITYFLWDAANRWIVAYNKPTLLSGVLSAVVADPTQVVEFNKETDDYPIDEGDVVELIELMKRDIIENKAYAPSIKWNGPDGEAQHPFKQTIQQTPQQ